MDYYCEICYKLINSKSKQKHLKSNIHKEFHICEYMELTIEKPNIDNVDEVFYAYIIQHIEQYDHYLIKCQFKLVFNGNHYSTWIKSNLFKEKTIISWKKYLKNVTDDFKNKGYNFSHFEEMNIMTKSNEMDMSDNFYNKHNMHAVEWKLKAMINKNKNSLNKFNETWRQPLNGKLATVEFKY